MKKQLRSLVGSSARRAREAVVRVLYGVGDDSRPSIAPPAVPGEKGLLRVHVGCGGIRLAGWYNVDERWFPHVHHVGSVERLSVLPDASAEVLYASHVLEHVSHRVALATLTEWARVLAPGGRLFVAVPDFDRIVERYMERRDIADVVGPLMGEQDYEANTHRAAYNRAHLASLMASAGFVDLRAFSGEEILGETQWDNSKHKMSLNLTGAKA